MKYFLRIIVLATLIYGFKCQRFSLSDSTGTWEQGLNACGGVQGTLAMVSNPQQQALFSNQVTRAQLGEKLWVGSYEAYTKLVWIQGCFGNTTLPTIRRTKIIPNNYLVPCLHECSGTNSAYLGMQGQYCYCFDSIPVNGGNLPGQACQSPCPGDPPTPQAPAAFLSKCGSLQAPQVSPVSVYRLARPGEIRVDNTTVNLGECFAYNIRTRTWAPRPCTSSYGVVCDRINCRGALQQCIAEIPVQVNWYMARQYCEANSAFMSVTNVSTSVYFNSKPVLGDTLYWTGMHRKQQMLWTTDSVTSSMIPSGRCMAVMKNQMGGWSSSIEDCQQQFKYVCYEELTTPQPTTTAWTTPTTSWVRPTTRPTWRPWRTTTIPTVSSTFLPFNVTQPNSASGLYSFAKIGITGLMSIVLHLILI